MSNIKESLKKYIFSTENFDVIEIKTSQIYFEERVKLKCFQCNKYNHKWTCPPKIPKLDYETIIKKEYSKRLLVRYKESINKENFEQVRLNTTVKLHQALLKAEKFLYDNNNVLVLSFIGGSCKLCKNGCNPEKCNNPQMARIPMEATGINVIKTVNEVGYNIKFPIEDSLSRYGLLLWEEKE